MLWAEALDGEKKRHRFFSSARFFSATPPCPTELVHVKVLIHC